MMAETGELRPCCKLDTSKIASWQKSYIKDGLDQYEANPGLDELKKSFLDGDKPDACHRCWTPESYGMVSHRRLLDDAHRRPGFGRFDLSLGNLCNLKCRICHPDESSRYIKEWQDLFGEQGKLSPTLDHNTIDIAKQIAVRSDNINIAGGEPLLIREHLIILDSIIQEGRADKTSLQYHTNGTILPDAEMLDIWSRFQSVEISFSLDGTRRKFEYNRHPALWDKIETNILRLKEIKSDNVKISVNTVLSVFTVDALQELFDWCIINDIQSPHLHILTNPPLFQVSVLPLSLQDELKIELLKQKHLGAKAAIGSLNRDDTHLLPALKHRIEIQDRYRNESFAEVFPRIAAHIFG